MALPTFPLNSKPCLALFIASSLLLVANNSHAQRSKEELLTCAQANFPETSAKERIELLSTDRLGGSRKIIGDLFWSPSRKQHSRILLKVDRPSDLAGASYLVLEHEQSDQMFMYLPSFQRVRRIVGKSRNQSLWGTDFSYNDIKQMRTLFARDLATLGEQQTILDRPAYSLIVTPQPEDESPYEKIIAWLDDETCLLLRADFYAQENRMAKQLSADTNALRMHEQKHYVASYVMRDLINETNTQLNIESLEYDVHVKPHLFNRKTFYD